LRFRNLGTSDLLVSEIALGTWLSYGEAEALEGVPRDRHLLATKLWGPMTDTDRGLSRAQVFKQIDGSLQRPKADHVDLYQRHRYDDDTPVAETMDALELEARHA